MITLEHLAEQIILDLSGGDKSKDSEIEMPDVILKIKQVASFLIKTNIVENIRYGGLSDISHHYINVETDIPVSFNTTYNQCYALLPMVPLSLPDNKGVKEVGSQKGGCVVFARIKSGQVNMIKDIIQDEIFYWPEKDRVVFHKDIRGKYSKVTMKLVAANPDDLADDEPFYLPPDMQAMVIQKVEDLMRSPALGPNMAPVDKSNDNNPAV